VLSGGTRCNGVMLKVWIYSKSASSRHRTHANRFAETFINLQQCAEGFAVCSVLIVEGIMVSVNHQLQTSEF